LPKRGILLPPPSFAIPITISSFFFAALFNLGQLSELLLDMLKPSFQFGELDRYDHIQIHSDHQP
jgi:hypothetical protein